MLLSLATTGGSVEVTGRGRRPGREMRFHAAKKKAEKAERRRWLARWRRPSHNAQFNSSLKTLVQAFIMAGTRLFLCAAKLSLGFRDSRFQGLLVAALFSAR